MGDRKRYLIRHFLSLVKIIHTRCHDIGVNRLEFFQLLVETDQLSATVRSPVSTIKQKHPVFRIESVGYGHCPASHHLQGEIRESISDVEFVGHRRPLKINFATIREQSGGTMSIIGSWFKYRDVS